MKKTLLTVLLNFAIATITFSQTINIGIKAGINLSEFSYGNKSVEDPHTNLPGYNIGAIFDLGLKNFSIQPGIFYTTKGNTYPQHTVPVNGLPFTIAASHSTLNYVEVPVNFLYKVHILPGAKLYFGGGPYLAIGTTASSSSNGVSYPIGFGTKSKTLYYFNTPDYGINFIAGIEVKKKILIGGGYGLGIRNVLEQGAPNDKNRVISFSVGYFFL